MKTNRLTALAVAVSSVFALSAAAGETEWWNVTLENESFQQGFPGLTFGELGALTNDAANMAAGTVQPYASGVWIAVDSDESYVTNEYFPTGNFGGNNCLRLDTQGNDLTWKPDTNDIPAGLQTLVDVDLYLVGSDSAPTDFDTAGDVQAAIYLKNLTDDESQETTNSVLCVYVYDQSIESNRWVELEGTTVTNENWAHVQVSVDSSTKKVSVTVNNTPMHARGDATSTSWTVANPTAPTATKINSIAFRGTGAVDNFVGKTLEEEVAQFNFTAQVLLDNSPVAADVSGNTTRVLQDWTVGIAAPFEGFSIDDYQYDELLDEETPATYGLSKIEIYDVTGTTILATFNYTYDESDGSATTEADDTDYVDFSAGDGTFKVTVATVGATGDATLAKIYFTSLNPPQPLTPEVDVGEGLAAYKAANPDADVPDPVAFNETTDLFEVSFVAPQTGRYVLMVCDTIDGTYVEDAGSAVNVATAGVPVTLTESTASATSKFFKIGYGPAE